MFHGQFGMEYDKNLYYISFVVHVEPFVVHGTIPLFSPRRGIDKEDTGGEQGQTQARFNKKSGFTNEQSRSTKEIPGYSLSTAQRDTLGRVYWALPEKVQKALQNGLIRGFSGVGGYFPFIICRACLGLSGASFPLRVLKWLRGGSRVSQSNKKRETLI